jgi:hypothetical protein
MCPHCGRVARARGLLRLTVVLVLLVLADPRPAAAYVDPLSGSVFLQVLAAGALSALFLIKSWWRRLVMLVRQLWARLRGR